MWWRGLTVFSQKYSFELRSNVRYIRHKPWVPKFRLIRQMQPWESPVDLSANKLNENESTSDLRRRLRRNGMLPPLLFYDRPINIGHTGQIFDPYVPPDGDGQTSLLSPKRLTHLKDELVDKGKNYKDLLLIRSHEPSFKSKPFASEAENIYIEAHNLLQNWIVTGKWNPGHAFRSIRDSLVECTCISMLMFTLGFELSLLRAKHHRVHH
ncbi:putative 39S ribosomal protein L45 isoform 3 [Schistosoma japonicum]|uniref:Putative 39S ribosomal protein L45 isoform 3 n=1 Tax=Schistosoma japonicum TaxID=6182 RepID=A0A4Z2CVA0_SCHJA|nr:putative 39S ribosomal protein L45 isoform 3 [Schistosoma japonicum]TNN08182.1 putative 39S ribosomal protein L45 isoform 3 [Schistosoma japonicum]